MGNIVLNGVVTTGTITPASPAAGSQFNLTNYSIDRSNLPELDRRRRPPALGNSSIAGTAALEGRRHRRHAGHRSRAGPPITINAPIPSPVPATGLTLNLPATPGTVGPFTATGGAISLTVDPAISPDAGRVGQQPDADVHALPEQHRGHGHREHGARPARRPRR